MKFYRDIILIVFALLFVVLINALTTPSIILTYYHYLYFWIVVGLIIISLGFLFVSVRSIDHKDSVKAKAENKALTDAIKTLNSKLNKLDKLDKLDKIDRLINLMEKGGKP